MPTTECPFCSNPNYLEAFTKGRAKKVMVPVLPPWRERDKFWNHDIQKSSEFMVRAETEQRAEFLRMMLDKENFGDRWREFTVEVFGIESVGEPFLPPDSERVIIEPPGPFFFFTSFFPEGDQPVRYYQFFICRITHENSDFSLVAHWWPTHWRLISVNGQLSVRAVNDDLDVIKTALDFFQRETRGSKPKFSEEAIADAFKRLDSSATQKAVANELEVTERTLDRWRARQGMTTWQEVVKRYGYLPDAKQS